MQAIRRYSHGGSHTGFTGPKGDDMSRQEKAVEQILQGMTFQSGDKKRNQFDTMDLMNILGAGGSGDTKEVNPYEPGTIEYSFFADPSLKEQFPDEYAKANMTPPAKNIIAYKDDDGNVRYKILRKTDKRGRGRYQDVGGLKDEQIQMLTPTELDNVQIQNLRKYINNPRFGQSVIQYLLGIDEEEPDVKKFKVRGKRAGSLGKKSANIGKGTTGGKGSTEYNWFQSFCDRFSRHPSCR